VVIAGIVVNVAVEWGAGRLLGAWAYQPWQPTLPPLGTGLLAVLQPIVVLPLVFWLVHRWRVGSGAARQPGP
jgi:hypothetical protein